VSETATPKNSLWFSILLGTLSATGPLAIDLYLPALPQMTTELQTTTSLAQLSITSCLIGLAIGQIIIGGLSDHFGRKNPLIIGFFLFGLASLAISFTSSITLLIILRFVQGICGASGQVLSRAVARDLFSGHKLTRFYAILNSINGVFPIIAPIIGGLMIHFMPWQGVFVLLGIIGFVLVVLIMVGLPETLPTEHRTVGNFWQSLKGMGSVFSIPHFATWTIATGLIYGALFSYISASSFIFEKTFHLSPQIFSLFYALNGLGMILGNNIPGWLTARYSDRTQVRGALIVTILASAGLLISATMKPQLMVVVALIWVFVIMNGMLLTLTTSIIMNLTDRHAGSASAMVGLSQNAFGSIASPLVGVLGTGYAPMAGLIMLTNLGALGLMGRKKKTT